MYFFYVEKISIQAIDLDGLIRPTYFHEILSTSEFQQI